jgi:hypothetical protein
MMMVTFVFVIANFIFSSFSFDMLRMLDFLETWIQLLVSRGMVASRRTDRDAMVVVVVVRVSYVDLSTGGPLPRIFINSEKVPPY